MKRYWHDPHHKRMSRKLGEKLQLRRRRLDAHRRNQRRKSEGISKEERRVLNEFKHLPIPARYPKAPNQMCFLRNPEEMAAFIGQLKMCLERRVPVFVDIRDVEELELNAITVLLAVMVQFTSRGIKFNGNMPVRPEVLQRLKESRFFEHLNAQSASLDIRRRRQSEQPGYFHQMNSINQQRESYDFPGSSIYTHGKRFVDSEFSQSLIDEAAKTIWGEPRRCTGLQRTFIELMQNTNNHASLHKSGEQHWWISLQHLKEDHKVVFCFVDFGIGVFESLAKKPPSNIFYRAIDKLKEVFRVTRNEQILKLIFEGELHKTVTGNYYRGKGLPGIYNVQQKDQVSKLSMITNDVYFTSADDQYRRLKTGFSGTFISWELSRQNDSLPNED
jgi:hypothetical protein